MANELNTTRNELRSTKNGLTETKNELTAAKNNLTTLHDDILTSVQRQLTSLGKEVFYVKRQLSYDENELRTIRPAAMSAQAELHALKLDLYHNILLPVAFTAMFSRDDAVNGVPISLHSILPFDLALTNLGNGYSNHSGVFTAPRAGTYCFFVKLMAAKGAHNTTVSLEQEGRPVDQVHAFAQDHNGQGSSMVTLHLEVGQRVWVRQQLGQAVRGGPYTIFTGFLLQADPPALSAEYGRT